MGEPNPEAVEFSRPIALDRLGDNGLDLTVNATPDERAALARRFDLVALDSLSAEVKLRRIGGGGIVRLSAVLTADVVQACVVTLDPVRGRVAENFSLRFMPDAGVATHEVVLSADDEDEGEMTVAGIVDVGEAVAQQLSLALDPYPRAAGVEVDDLMPADEDKAASHPFARLSALKERRGSR